MEPSLNPALESQAIGRVHRLGQKRSVEVVRLVIEDSVESRLVENLKVKYGTQGSPSDKSGGDVKGGSRKDVKVGLVGNLCTERANVVMEEFDLLFGVESLAKEEVPTTSEAAADQVMSSMDL
jgi:hypothetical protein